MRMTSERSSRRAGKIRAFLGWGATGLALAPLPAFAHPGLGHVHGFAEGFAHPISGMDHLLAMVAVGLLATQLGGRALWLLPATFVGVMGLAGFGAMAGMDLPFVEAGIAASVLGLGLAVASQWRMPTLIAAALVGFFAIFHGHAHGAEMPRTLSGLAYAIGFLSATALLHAIGLGLGLGVVSASRTTSHRTIQLGGAAIAAAGAALLASP